MTDTSTTSSVPWAVDSEMVEQSAQLAGLSGLLIVSSAIALWARYRARNLLGAVGGLHLNVLLFFGLGTLAYGLSPLSSERGHRVFEAFLRAGWLLAASYGAVAAWDVWRNLRSKDGGQDSASTDVTPAMLAGFVGLALLGHLGSQTTFANSGIGTIFPVLKMFWYPVIGQSVAKARIRSPFSIAIAIVSLAASAMLAFYSVWRSELILMGGAIILGLVMRGRRWLVLSPALIAALIGVALPFVDMKKVQYDLVIEDPAAAFDQTLAMPLGGRLDFITQLWAIRVNGAREIGFVTDGLESGRTQTRGGETYLEAVQQLVPRILWPDKPAFNLISNYHLARDLGLVGPSDPGTSWGVNLYAEAVWNFGPACLLWFVALAFAGARLFDSLVRRRIGRSGLRWFVSTGLFFFFMGGVGLVNAATYILWIILLGIAMDYLTRIRAFDSFVPRAGTLQGGRVRASSTEQRVSQRHT